MPLLKLAEHYFYILSRFFRVDSFFRPFRFALCHSSLYQKVKIFTFWHSFLKGQITRTELQRLCQPLRTKVSQLLRLGAEGSHKKTAGTCRDILKREEALWAFIDHDGVVPTNNFAEQQIRPAVLWRKSSFGTQSKCGSHFVERLMTVVASLKLQQRNVLDYLVEVCQTANSHSKPPALIPVNSSVHNL
ncbi:transposase [Chloroflexi bacterium TSY]|nr:transposase [Chloroflexi bacterium TSY]